jgi:cation:H+ antiporter
MNLITLILFFSGFLILIVGAEALVRGASRLAAAIGISPLVIGLTIVAYGTSSPELAVSIQSAFLNQADIALGNVVGSNIFNILFILGISARSHKSRLLSMTDTICETSSSRSNVNLSTF